MQHDIEEQIRVVWQELQQRYSWSLFDDPEAFLREVISDLSAKFSQSPGSAQIRTIIQQQYYRSLYQAVIAARLNPRDNVLRESANRACNDVYVMAWRLALYRGYDQKDAEEAAQKVVEQLIARPDHIRKPESLFSWVGWHLRAVLKQDPRTTTIDHEEFEEKLNQESASKRDISAQVEDAILAQTIIDVLPAILSTFQQQIIEVVVLQGHPPREAADILQTTSHRIRVEKSRALEIIRNHPLIQSWLRTE